MTWARRLRGETSERGLERVLGFVSHTSYRYSVLRTVLLQCAAVPSAKAQTFRMVRPAFGAKLRMMFAVYSFVESLNFNAALMMVVTDWFYVRVDEYGLVEVFFVLLSSL